MTERQHTDRLKKRIERNLAKQMFLNDQLSERLKDKKKKRKKEKDRHTVTDLMSDNVNETSLKDPNVDGKRLKMDSVLLSSQNVPVDEQKRVQIKLCSTPSTDTDSSSSDGSTTDSESESEDK